jgi:copper transport protein
MQFTRTGTTAGPPLVRTRGPHRALPALLTSWVVLLLTVLGAPAAVAHTELTTTTPAQGQVLGQAPADITLAFNEPIGASPETVQVYAPTGEAVPVDVEALNTTVTLTPGASLGTGTHTVVWEVASADGHPVTGSFTFSVIAPSTTTAQPPESDPAPQAAIAAQTVTYLGVFAATGLVVFELLFLTAGPGTALRTRGRLHRLTHLAAVIATVGAVFSTLATRGQDAALPGLLTDPTLVAALTVAGVLTAVVAVPRATTGPRARPARTVALAGVGVAAVSLVLTGHPRSAEAGWLVIPADAVHVAAGITWVGGLLGLTVLLARASDTPVGQATTTLVRFSTAAAWVVLALALTGTVLIWGILGDLQALVATGYGQVLLIKLAVVVFIVLAASWNRFILLPRVLAGDDSQAIASLRSTIQGEAVVLGLILLITGILTNLSP